MKRIFILMFVVAILATTNVFATGTSDPSMVGDREVLDVTLGYKVAPASMWTETPTLYQKEMVKRFGINFEYIIYPPEAYIDKLTLLMATDEHPELINEGPRPWDVNAWASEGYITPLDDYLDLIPLYRALWSDEEWEYMNERVRAPDGHMYLLPMQNNNRNVFTWIYKKSHFDKIGLEFPKNTTELYEALKALKKEFPEFIGLTGTPWPQLRRTFRTDENFFVDTDRTKSELTYGPTTEKFRDLMKYVYKLYVEDLVDPEFATLDYQQWSERYARGQAAIMRHWVSRAPWANTTDQDPEAHWEASLSYISHYEGKPTLVQFLEPHQPWGPIITNKASEEKIERIMEYFNWTCTDEGWDFLNMGVEGITFKYENGTPVNILTGEHRITDYGFHWLRIRTRLPDYLPQNEANKLVKALVETVDGMENMEKLRGGAFAGGGFPWLSTDFSEEESKDYADMAVVVNQARDEYIMKFSIGQLDPNNDAVWADFQKALKNTGLEELTTLVNKVFKRNPYNLQ